MRIIYQASLDVDSTANEHSVTDGFLTLVPEFARLEPVQARENTHQRIDFLSILGNQTLQATHCAVDIRGLDNATDSQLKIDIEGSIDGLSWEQISQQTGFAFVTAFDVTSYAMIRARTTTAAASGTQAQISFMLTRTP